MFTFGRCLSAVIGVAFALAGSPAHADKRVALVIGNGAYAHATHLPNPRHDAEDVAAALQRTGFETILGVDLDKAGMDDAAIRFARAARTADVAVFYYSGHAMQFAGVNYLMPIDAKLSDEADLRRMARVDEILADLQQAKNLRILVLDSCRDNPLADELKRSIGLIRSANIARGLAKMESPDGTIISYSTQAGRTAVDGDGRNSPYTTAFLKHIEAKDNITNVFHHISAEVYQTTSGTQVPELSLSFFGEFYLNGKLQTEVGSTSAPAALPLASPPAADPVAQAWTAAKDTTSQTVLEDFIRRFSDSFYATLARARLEELKKSQVAAISPQAEKSGVQDLTTPAPTSSPVGAATGTVPDVVRSFIDAVVNIPTPRLPTIELFDEFFKNRRVQGDNAESPPHRVNSFGFIIDPSGLVVTNQHVVQDAKDITIVLRDGTSLNAKVLGSDQRTDLALLRVKTDKPLKAVRLGDSSKVTAGQKIAALANASVAEDSLKLGTVVALNVDLNVSSNVRFVEIDIGIPEGTSGTPLFNLDGEVIGVNAAGTPAGQNVNARFFAVPTMTAVAVIDQLRQFGEVRRGWIGVRIQPVTEDIADSLGIKPVGALVAWADGRGPAKSAGVEPGDVIVGFDGKDIKEVHDLPQLVAVTSPSKTVEIVVLRKGKEIKKTVTLGRLPEIAASPATNAQPSKPTPTSPPPPGTKTTKVLGLDLAGLTDRLREHYNVKSTASGVVVTSGGDASAISVGDVILEVSGTPVASVADMQRRVEELKKSGNKTALLLIVNPDTRFFVALRLR
jgi:S1-C subfamily serine protease